MVQVCNKYDGPAWLLEQRRSRTTLQGPQRAPQTLNGGRQILGRLLAQLSRQRQLIQELERVPQMLTGRFH